MFSIRPARPEDKDAIWRVHVAAIRETCQTHYSQQQIDTWAGIFTPASYEGVLRDRQMVVAVAGEQVIGFGQLNVDARSIEAVYVSPAHVNRGAGAAILDRLEQIARANGIDRLTLGATLNGVDFYARQGYTRQGEARLKIGEGVELAYFQMEKELSKAE